MLFSSYLRSLHAQLLHIFGTVGDLSWVTSLVTEGILEQAGAGILEGRLVVGLLLEVGFLDGALRAL